jgi:hypothetical protein
MQSLATSTIGAERRVDDVLLITVVGAVTDQTYEAALERVSREASARRIRALVLDLTRVGPGMTAGRGFRASEQFCADHRELPWGIVVPAPMLSSIRRECFRVSAIGVTWIAFLRLRDAFEWASTRSWSVAGDVRHPPPFPSEYPTPPLLH